MDTPQHTGNEPNYGRVLGVVFGVALLGLVGWHGLAPGALFTHGHITVRVTVASGLWLDWSLVAKLGSQ